MRKYLLAAFLFVFGCAAPFSPLVGQTTNSCTNLPAGLTLKSTRHFNVPVPDWNDVSRFNLVQDATAPDGDGWVGQETYTTSNRVGNATMASYLIPNFTGKGYKTLYSCFWTKLDPAFTFTYPGGFFGTKQYWFLVGPNSGENKIFTNFYSPNPGNGNGLTSPVYFGLVLQGVPNKTSYGLRVNKAVGTVQRGVWYKVELLAQMNSVSSANDGWIKMWVNGALDAQVSNVRWTQVNGMVDSSHVVIVNGVKKYLPWTKATDVAEWYGTKWNNTLGGGSAYCTAKNSSGVYIHNDSYCFAPKTEWIWFDNQVIYVK
jgi:hypothetical protein